MSSISGTNSASGSSNNNNSGNSSSSTTSNIGVSNNSSNNNTNTSSSSSSLSNGIEKDKMWYFSSEQLKNSPSRRCGVKFDQELSYRQLTAYLIQEMGQRLQVSQLCINTAIVYMHRFYAFHSFTHFHRNSIAAATLFLAAKVEEQPRKLEHVIKAANKCLPPTSEVNYADQAQDLVFNENVLLQTLGFDVAIDHPHTHVVKTCHLVKACKDLAQTSYFLASNSLHLTSMCLQYRPTVVACFCIYLACKWSRWEIPQSTEGRHWFYYVDKTVTLDLLKQLTEEFIAIYEKSPTRLQSKLNSIKAIAQGASNRGMKDKSKEDFKMGDIMKGYHSSINTSDSNSNGSFSDVAVQQPSQSQATALLPPPSQPPPALRKSDIHSSQHRTHHNTASAAHHNKSTYNVTGDAISDHKLKQSSYGSNVVNRPPPNLQSMPSSSQRPNMPSGSSRPSSSNNLPSQRPPPPQMHPVDYHKSSTSSREIRNGLPGAHGVPPHQQPHKMQSKQQPDLSSTVRSSSKDPMNRMPDLTIKQSSNKLYPGGPPPYGSNSQLPPLIPSNKVEDPSRNMLHNQRYMPSSGGSNPGGQPTSGNYHHHRTGGNTGSSTNSSSSTSKSSVLGSFEPIPPMYGNQMHQQNINNNFAGLRGSSSEMQVDDYTSGSSHNHASIHQIITQPTQPKAPSATSSLFSPDCKDKPQQQQHHNGPVSQTHHDGLVYKFPGTSRDKNSPKKERSSSSSSGTPTKKDKSRMSSTSIGSVSTSNVGGLASMRNEQHNQLLKSSGSQPPRKSETAPGVPAAQNELAGSSQVVGGIAGMKRTNELTGYTKYDDDNLQRDKMRKMDNTSQGTIGLSSFQFPGGNKNTDKHPIAISNGIETTPDLVRTLLKESYTLPLLKTEPLTNPGLKPPAELLDPCAGQAATSFHNSGSSNSNHIETPIDAQSQVEQTSNNGDDKLDNSKDKKKKKEKHKHKEKDKDKDKSKDREERKKHKKDKDKHKDRDRDGDKLEPVKVVIPKLKIATQHYKPTDSNSTGQLQQASSGLKITISKDVLQNYNAGAAYAGGSSSNSSQSTLHNNLSQSQMNLGMSSHASGGIGNVTNPNVLPNNMAYGAINMGGANAGGGNNIINTSSSTTSSSSSKKKDRDRDRDKEKKRSSNEFAKYNGNNGNAQHFLTGLGNMIPTTSAPMMHMPPSTLMTTVNTSNNNSASASGYAKK